MKGLLCIINPASCVSVAAKSTFNLFFDAITSWILASVQWLLTAAGQVLTSASEPSTVLQGAKSEFTTLLTIAPILLILGLLVSTIQALRHGDASSLWRVYFGVAPAAVLGIVLARPMATLILEAVNQLSSTAATNVVQHEGTLASALLNIAPGTPAFGVFLMTCAVVVGTWLLWCELILRVVILTLLLVFVPVIVPLSTFPSMRRLGWRLGETFIAVAASKFVIVVTLVLGLDEITGNSATEIVTGAVTILLSTCTPFVVMRIIPFLEQSALHAVDGLRSRMTRGARSVTAGPTAMAMSALSGNDTPESGPPERTEDLGLGSWPSSPESEMPPTEGTRPAPPIGEPRRRTGHVAYRHDEKGPIVGWHFDE